MISQHRFFAPGRLNIIGEHTDYSGGYVMPAPLSIGVYLEKVVPATDWDIRSLTTGEFFSGDPESTWSGSAALHAFIRALTFTLRQRGFKVRPFSGVLNADLPPGNGLSSSTALTSVLLYATATISGWSIDRHQMALLAQAVEQEMGINCGIMDQYCMWMGHPGKAMLLDCQTMDYRPVSLELPGYRWYLILSGVKHRLLESPYNERRAQLIHGMQQVVEKGYAEDFLKNFAPEVEKAILQLPDPVERSRVHYVWKENFRVLEMERALIRQDAHTVMQLLNAGHDGLAKEYEVSCPEIDQLVSICRRAIPEIGIRMVGGGFGGSLLVLVRDDLPSGSLPEILDEYRAMYPVKAELLPVSLGGPVVELTRDSSFL